MFSRRSEFTEGWGLTPPCLEPWARTEVIARAFSRRPKRAAQFLGASGAPAREKTYRSAAHHEEQFHIQVLDEELVPENFQTVRKVAEYIQRKSASAKP